jgi:hypothetical protein
MKLMRKAAPAALLAALLVVSVPTVASAAEPTPESPAAATAASSEANAVDATVAPRATGQYEWVCVGTDGNSYSMTPGEPTSNCHGSYLQKYLDGSQLATYNLAYNGQGELADPDANSCVLGMAGNMMLIIFPPTSIEGWVSAATGVGLGLASCVV